MTAAESYHVDQLRRMWPYLAVETRVDILRLMKARTPRLARALILRAAKESCGVVIPEGTQGTEGTKGT